jgi:hypothetical protein
MPAIHTSYSREETLTFKCAACYHQFSVTSGTIFACRKLSFVDLLAAICLFVNAAKGTSALQFSRDLDVQYKTAFVLAHKLREALAAETRGEAKAPASNYRSTRPRRSRRRLFRQHRPVGDLITDEREASRSAH